MSAAPSLSITTQPSALRTPPDSSRWIAIDKAARILGVSTDHLRRLCRERLEAHGQAMQAARETDGTVCWHVARSFDRRLAPGSVGQLFQTPELSVYTDKQVETARQRAACVEALKHARTTWRGDQKDWLPTLVQQLQAKHPELKVSQGSLRRWYRQYRTPADLMKLIDGRGGNQKGEADPAAWDYFRSIYLDERQPTLKTCWARTKQACREQGLTWCSYDQCRRLLDTKVPPDVRAQFREPKKWLSAFSPFIEQDSERFAAGQCWIGDHAQLDMWCYFDGKLIRPWLTAWMDWRTRRLVGYTLSDSPNSSTILAALRVALTDEANLGGPDQVWIDNGKDYDAYVFHGQTKRERKQRITDRLSLDETQAEGIFGHLDIAPHFSIPYNARGKGRLERWFKVLHSNFDSTFSTYTGSSPETRPDTLAGILKQPHKVPKFEHVQSRLGEFIAGYNADADHQRKDMAGLSPDQAIAQWAQRRRVMADPAALDQLLQHWSRPVRVGRNGVGIKPRGHTIRYGQHDQALMPLKRTGRKVRVAYDPADLRTVKVYDEQWRFICEAGMNAGGAGLPHAVSDKHVGEVIREQRQYKASKRQMRRHFELEYMSREELLAQQAEPPKKAPPDVPLQIVQTPLDGQSKAVEAASGGEKRRQRRRPRKSLAELMGQKHEPEEADTSQDEADQDDILERLWNQPVFDEVADQDDDDRFDLLDGRKEGVA